MYRINELFYSLQGEGHHAGRAALFVRFSGCNLQCPFCDTQHLPHTHMSADEIVKELEHLSPSCHFVVLTGGEPMLQVDEPLIATLHQAGYTIAMETNGTLPVPTSIDFVTISPKQEFVPNAELRNTRCDEVKVIFDGEHPVSDYGLQTTYRFLQPCDTGNAERNQTITAACIRYIQSHPAWQLSLQLHKILHIA